MQPFKFIHVSDLHLGKKQYNLEIRYKDYFNAFQQILNFALKKAVDFIVISGDIFDNRKIDPSVLSEVFTIVQDFKIKCRNTLNKDIPLICIEGNHDNPLSSSKSWMSFLADLNLIVLLSGFYDVSSKEIIFLPFYENTRRGGFIRIKDCCIYGIPFYGSFTPKLFPAISNAIKRDPDVFNILLMHFGVKGYDESKPGISYEEDFKQLHEKIDYMALGHYHRYYVHPKEDPWIFNPGSIEVNNIRELFSLKLDGKSWDNNWRSERGIILAEIKSMDKFQQNYELIEFDNGCTNYDMIPNRKFFSLEPIDISQSPSFEEAIKMIVEQLKRLIPLKKQEKKIPDEDLNKMIIILPLKGEIPYSRIELDMKKLRDVILDTFEILDVRIFSKGLFSTLDYIDSSGEEKSIDELEREIFLQIIEQNPKYTAKSTQIVDLIDDIKTRLLVKKPDYPSLNERIKGWSIINYEEFHDMALNPIVKDSGIDLEDLSIEDYTYSPDMKVIPKTDKEEDTEEDDKELELYEDLELDLDDYIDDEDKKREEE